MRIRPSPCKFYAPQCVSLLLAICDIIFRPPGHLVNDHFRTSDLSLKLLMMWDNVVTSSLLTIRSCKLRETESVAAKEVVDI